MICDVVCNKVEGFKIYDLGFKKKQRDFVALFLYRVYILFLYTIVYYSLINPKCFKAGMIFGARVSLSRLFMDSQFHF